MGKQEVLCTVGESANGMMPVKVNSDIICEIRMQIPLRGISLKDGLVRVHKEVVFSRMQSIYNSPVCSFHQWGNDSLTYCTYSGILGSPLKTRQITQCLPDKKLSPKPIVMWTKAELMTLCITSNHLCIKHTLQLKGQEGLCKFIFA